MRKYTRNDVEYSTWYSTWMKQLAQNYTEQELECMLYGASKDAKHSALQHLNAIAKSHSMSSNSQRRAQTRNVTAAAGDKAIAIRGAIEIHELFPEFARQK